MDKKIMIFAVIAIVALVVAVVALGVALILISGYHSTISPSPTSAMPTSGQPTASTTITPMPYSTPAPSITPTEPFNPTITTSFWNWYYNSSATPLINTSSIISSGTIYGLNVTLTNPATSEPSPYPCNITLVLTEENTNRPALPTDASLSVSILGKDLYGGIDQADDSVLQIPAIVSENTLTFSLAPYGSFGFELTGLSPDGVTVYSGFNETFGMFITFNISGVFNCTANLVPAI